jgi:acetyltransferase
MEEHAINPLFEPRSVAVIGATDTRNSVGHVVLRNLLEGGYTGRVFAVNPNRREVMGLPVHASVEEIPEPLDLALIATPAETILQIVEQCGKRRVCAALIYATGFGDGERRGAELQRELVQLAKHYGVRVLGPGSLGIIRPALALNASFTHAKVIAGKVALVSHSGALVSAILDWAGDNAVGFSSVISLGASADVRFSDALDYLLTDPETESILLYVEGIYNVRRFMSSLRAAARAKPVIVFKAGRQPGGYRAATTHSGAMVGSDDVFDAALGRAGAVRVDTFVQLFSAAQCLSSRYKAFDNRIAILSNGGGPGVIAADWTADCGVKLATLSQATLDRLDAALPPDWSRANPVDILEDASPERYREATRACLEDAEVDGVLAILTPQAMSLPEETAKAVIELGASHEKPLVACWMGDTQVGLARQLLSRSRLPTFRTPEPAVESFSHIARYYRSQKLLMQVPGPLSRQDPPDVEGAKLVIEIALGERRKQLNEMESKALLAAFRVPLTHTVIARSPTEAIMIAEQIGFPVALKVSSPDISHRSELSGVQLNVANARAVHAAYQEIMAEVPKAAPEARIEGVAIQPMSRMTNARELLIGVVSDPVFGPVIAFGAGGTMTEIAADRAIALPPLNHFLAQDLISRTRVSKMLDEYRSLPQANREALESVLLRVSEMVCELPWLKEMDINPLLLDENGACAVDARIVVDDLGAGFTGAYSHMAIHPYPAQLEQEYMLPDGTAVSIRPIRPEDGELVKQGFAQLSAESRYFRFMNVLSEMPQNMLVRFTQLDYDKEMGLLAIASVGGKDEELGIARYVINADGEDCEFALVVLDAWQQRGIGTRLMLALMDAARGRGLKMMQGDVLANNPRMLKLLTNLGFTVTPSEEDPSLRRAVRELSEPR